MTGSSDQATLQVRPAALMPTLRAEGMPEWRTMALMRLFRRPEPVEMVEQRYNFLPHSFRWRGALWRVRVVVRSWDRPRATLQPPLRCFEVICAGGDTCLLMQDLRVGAWYIRL